MAKTLKKDSTYDKRNKAGRQAAGKSLQPKKIKTKFGKALKNNNKPGKKI